MSSRRAVLNHPAPSSPLPHWSYHQTTARHFSSLLPLSRGCPRVCIPFPSNDFQQSNSQPFSFHHLPTVPGGVGVHTHPWSTGHTNPPVPDGLTAKAPSLDRVERVAGARGYERRQHGITQIAGDLLAVGQGPVPEVFEGPAAIRWQTAGGHVGPSETDQRIGLFARGVGERNAQITGDGFFARGARGDYAGVGAADEPARGVLDARGRRTGQPVDGEGNAELRCGCAHRCAPTRVAVPRSENDSRFAPNKTLGRTNRK